MESVEIEKRCAGIYRICNTATGKAYIGKTETTFVFRWLQHRHHLKHGKHYNKRLQADWTAYGADAFRFQVIEIIDRDLGQAFFIEREQHYITTAQQPLYNARTTESQKMQPQLDNGDDAADSVITALDDADVEAVDIPESMPKLRVQQLARAYNLNISQLQIKAAVSMGTVRRYWYGTRDGKETGPPLTEVDLVILDKIAKALEVRIADLIEEDERLAPTPAVGWRPQRESGLKTSSGSLAPTSVPLLTSSGF